MILAGGRSRRFGTHKADHVWRGRPLLDHVRAALAPVFPNVVLLGGPGADLADDHPGAGPVAALATAFADLPDDHLFLTACDLPLLTPEVVRFVAHHPAAPPDHAVVPKTPAGRAQPLVARYPRACLQALEDPANRSLTGLLDRIDVTYVVPPVPPDWALNINRLTDLP